MGGGDHVGEKRLDLAHGGAAIDGGLGARNADGDAGKMRVDAFRPGVATGGRGSQLLAGGTVPARPRQFAERGGGVAIDHHLNVVERLVGLVTRIDAEIVCRIVRRGIPATDRNVEAAAEGETVVDDDDFLVMGSAEWNFIIEAEIDVARRVPAERHGGQQLALHRVDDRIVPEEELYLEVRVLPRESGNEFAECFGKVIIHLAGGTDKARAAVDVPADDQDRMAGILHRRAQGLEIMRSIDDRGGHAPPSTRQTLRDGLKTPVFSDSSAREKS